MYRYRFQYTVLYLLIYLFPFTTFSQERGLIQSKFYCIKDYNAAPQNWAIAQDQRGVMYFGNSVGVLEFDGENWKLFRVSNHSTVRSLGVDKNGVIYVGAFGEMGYMQPDSKGEMKYTSLMPFIDKKYTDFKEVWDIYCFGDTVFFYSDNYLFRYYNGKFKYWESKTKSFYLSFAVNNEYLVQEKGRGLLKLQNDSLVLIKGGEYFSKIQIHNIFPYRNGYLLGTRHHGFFIYDSTCVNPIKSISDISSNALSVNEYFIKNSYYHGVKVSDSLYALSSIQADVLVVDNKWRVKDVVSSDTKGVISPNYFLYFQGGHNLWLALDNGISFVELMSPFRFWDESLGINGVVSDVAQKGNYHYVTTTSGIFCIDRSQDEFKLSHFSKVEGRFEQAWQFLYFQPPSQSPEYYLKNPASMMPYLANGNTVLLAATLSGIYQLNGTRAKKISRYESTTNLLQSYSNPYKVMVGMSNGVAQLNYRNGTWIDEGRRFGIDANIIDIGEDADRNLWISTRFKGIYRVKNPFAIDSSQVVVEKYDSTAGIPNYETITFFDEYKPFLLHGSSNYYYFDDSTKQFNVYTFPKENVSETKREKQISDSIAWEGMYQDINSGFYIVDANDKNTWFSTNDGIFKHIPDSSRNFYMLPAALIRKVSSGDSVLFYGTNVKNIGNDSYAIDTFSVVDLGITLGYKNNSLTFLYAWPFFEGNKPNQYSYMLKGYSNTWSEWTTETKKEYTNLHEGEYTFLVKAKNIYGIECKPAEFKFTISPPWSRTYLAFFIYLILGVLFIVGVVKLYTYKLIVEKNKLEEVVKERTQEILIQNEEILVQAEHLKDANDWISAKNVELESQKHELELKKNELEISNATKNKFFRIIAHDLRNPISTLVNTTGFILSDFDDFDRQKTKRMIGDLNKLSLTTYGLIENLLDWSSNQMGHVQFNPTKLDLKAIVKENVELIKTKIESKSISLSISIPDDLIVFADENMLCTVIRNIVTNAAKFTHENGTIRIYTVADDEFCYLSIADNGVGISPDIVKKLFHIDKDIISIGTHNEKGSGLGLILSKEFVERNGGSITVESELGKGSTFTISLKLG